MIWLNNGYEYLWYFVIILIDNEFKDCKVKVLSMILYGVCYFYCIS